MSKLKALLEKKASLQSEMRAMSETITKETRAMTEEETTKWAELRTQLAGITSTIDAIQEMRDLDDAEEQEDGDDPAETPEQVEEKENRAFANYIRAVAQGKEARADANLTFSDSSNAVVPKTIAKKIVAKIYDISPVADKATKYVTKGTLEIPVYGANSGTDITVAYGTEFTDLESKIGKFGSVELQNFLAGALTKLSNSLINNADVDIVSFVVDRLAYEVSRFIERELLLGTDNKVQGMRTLEAGQIISTIAESVVSADDLVKLKNKVKQAFRNGAIWVMSTNTKTAVELLKDGNERYLFNEDPTGEYDGRIFGYPVYVSDSMADVADEALVIYFGNFAGLALKWSEQLEINVLREKYATQHATGLVGWFEFDSKVENNQMLAGLEVTAEA